MSVSLRFLSFFPASVDIFWRTFVFFSLSTFFFPPPMRLFDVGRCPPPPPVESNWLIEAGLEKSPHVRIFFLSKVSMAGL